MEEEKFVELKLERLGKQTNDFPVQFKDGKFYKWHESLNNYDDDSIIILKHEGNDIIVYRVLK